MQILEAMGIKYAKPVSRTSDKKPAISADKAEKRTNTDRIQLTAPSVMLREADAASFADALKEKLMESPSAASSVHVADYRLMDAMRSREP